MDPKEVEIILETVRSRKQAKSKGLWATFDRLDRALWLIAAGCFALAVILGYLHKYLPNFSPKPVVAGFYSFLLLGQIAPVLTVIKQLISAPLNGVKYGLLRALTGPSTAIWDVHQPKILRDAAISNELKKSGKAELDFVAKRIKLEADQLRRRIQLVTPGIETVGLIPALSGIAFTLFNGAEQLQRKAGFQITSLQLLLPVAAIAILYAMGTVLVLASYRLEQLAQLVACAGERSGKEDTVSELPGS